MNLACLASWITDTKFRDIRLGDWFLFGLFACQY